MVAKSYNKNRTEKARWRKKTKKSGNIANLNSIEVTVEHEPLLRNRKWRLNKYELPQR